MSDDSKTADGPEPAGARAPRGDSWGAAVGMETLEASGERVRTRVVIGPQHHQPYGIVHGGVYCSIVEGVASYGAGINVHESGSGKSVVGVSNHTDFLRSHGEGELIAVGEPVHVGRNAQLWKVDIRRTSDDKLVAQGQVRFHVLQRTGDEVRAYARERDHRDG